MTVTSVTAVAVSFRSVTLADPQSAAPSTTPPAPAPDTVELSQRAAAEPRASDAASRSETLLKTLDADGDGVVTKEEFTGGAIELLKHASVRFHHHHVGRGEGIEKRDARWTARLEDVFTKVDANHDGSVDQGEVQSALSNTSQAIRQYTLAGQSRIAKV